MADDTDDKNKNKGTLNVSSDTTAKPITKEKKPTEGKVLKLVPAVVAEETTKEGEAGDVFINFDAIAILQGFIQQLEKGEIVGGAFCCLDQTGNLSFWYSQGTSTIFALSGGLSYLGHVMHTDLLLDNLYAEEEDE